MSDPFAPLGGARPNGKEPSSKAPKWRALAPAPADAPPPPPQAHPKLGKPSATWTYRGPIGELLGYVLRFDSPSGKQFRPLVLFENVATGAREWRWESWPAPRPLYGLDALSAHPQAIVVVCEGEKAADAARRLLPDCVVLTSLSGSKSARKADWSALRGRIVIIWPDADKPGADYAADVADQARRADARSVAVLAPPASVADGWDAADAEAEGWTQQQAAAFLATARSADATPESDGAQDKAAGRRRTPQRDIILAAVEDVDLWHAPDGETFATFKVKTHRENWPIRSTVFRRWLACTVYEASAAVPGAQALEDALRILEARATMWGEERAAWLRVGGRKDRLYIDLCDAAWRAIEVDAHGWRILERHDLPFVRSAAMRPMVEPEAGCGLETLRGYVNADDESFMLVVAWLIAALRPVGPYPILAVGGEQGSGKSSFSRLLRALSDPNAAPIRSAPRDDRDLLVSAVNGHGLVFDNLSSVPPWLADALCRLATGGGFAARALHTDREEIVLQATRPIVLNGIPELTTRADLADRAIAVRLRAIPEDERRPEDEIEKDLARDLPRILGALLDGVSAGLRNIGKVRLDRAPRLADFAKWIVACAPGLGWEGSQFLDCYMANRRDAADGAFEADPVAVAIKSLSDAHSYWSGTPTELLSALSERVSESVKRSRAWPLTPQGLGNAVERVKPLLRERGVVVERKHSGHRSITIARLSATQDREGED